MSDLKTFGNQKFRKTYNRLKNFVIGDSFCFLICCCIHSINGRGELLLLGEVILVKIHDDLFSILEEELTRIKIIKKIDEEFL